MQPFSLPQRQSSIPEEATMIGAWTTDLRHAWRALMRTPGFFVTCRRHPRARDRRCRRDVQRRRHGAPQAAPLPATRSASSPSAAPRPARTCRSASTSAPSSTSTTRKARSCWTASSCSARGTSTLRTDNRVERIPMAWPTNDMYATLGVRPQLGRLPRAGGWGRRRGHQRPAVEQLVRPRPVGRSGSRTSSRTA